MGGKVFGVVNYLNPGPTTLALIGVLLLLVFLQVLFEYLEKWAEQFGQIEIYNKLQYELMILGLISFAIFIIQVAAANDPLVTSSEYFISFDFAHILVLFIAFSFMAQALILVQFAHYDGKEFVKMVRVTEDELLEDFRQTHPGEAEKLLLLERNISKSYNNNAATANNSTVSTTNESKVENNNNQSVVEPMTMMNKNASHRPLLLPNHDNNHTNNDNIRSSHSHSIPRRVSINHHHSIHSIHSSNNSHSSSTPFLSWANIYGGTKSTRISLHKSHSHRVTISPPPSKNTSTTTTTAALYQMPKKYWRKIEFKIIEELFLLCHHFPKEFNFGAYVSYQLHTYIAEVGEASWVSWLALAAVAVVNYIKTIVDNVAENYECRNQDVDQLWGCGGYCDSSSYYNLSYSSYSSYATYSSDYSSSITSSTAAGASTNNESFISSELLSYVWYIPSIVVSIVQSTSHSAYHVVHTGTQVTARVLAGSSEDLPFAGYVSEDLHCYLFFFTYCFVCAFALNVTIFGIYYASCYYEHAMIQKGIKEVFPDLYKQQLLNQQQQQQQQQQKDSNNKTKSSIKSKYHTTTATTSPTSSSTSTTLSENCVSNFHNFAFGASTDTHILYIHCLKKLQDNRKQREDEVYRELNLPLPDDEDDDDGSIKSGDGNSSGRNYNNNADSASPSNKNGNNRTTNNTSAGTGKGVKITSEELEKITQENEHLANKRRHERELKKETKRLRSKSLHNNKITPAVHSTINDGPINNNTSCDPLTALPAMLPAIIPVVVIPPKVLFMRRMLITFGLSSSLLVDDRPVYQSNKYHNNGPINNSKNNTTNGENHIVSFDNNTASNEQKDEIDSIDDDVDYDEGDEKDIESGSGHNKSHNNNIVNTNKSIDADDANILSITPMKPKPKIKLQLEPITINSNNKTTSSSTLPPRQNSKQLLLQKQQKSSSQNGNNELGPNITYTNNNSSKKGNLQKQPSLSSPRCKVDTWSVFWLQRPDIYFFFVEFAILLQSFYLAIYFTQILPISIEQHEVGWGVALFVMPIIGFRFLYLILHRSVLLHATTKLNKQLVGKVCEEAILEITISEEVRVKVNEYFSVEDLQTEKGKIDFVRKHLDPDSSNEVDKVEFRSFLGTIDVYLSKQKFELLWKLVDDDLSGSISMDEIFIFLFPEMKRSLKEEMKIVSMLRQEFKMILVEQQITELKYIDFLQQHFDVYDTDHSGSLDKEEVREMIGSFDITIEDDKSFELLMATMNTDDNDEIEFFEFVELVLPLSVREEINSKNGFGNKTGRQNSSGGMLHAAGSFMKALSPRSVYNTLSSRRSSQQQSTRSQKSQNSQQNSPQQRKSSKHVSTRSLDSVPEHHHHDSDKSSTRNTNGNNNGSTSSGNNVTSTPTSPTSPLLLLSTARSDIESSNRGLECLNKWSTE